jgi:hypothetical protein
MSIDFETLKSVSSIHVSTPRPVAPSSTAAKLSCTHRVPACRASRWHSADGWFLANLDSVDLSSELDVPPQTPSSSPGAASIVTKAEQQPVDPQKTPVLPPPTVQPVSPTPMASSMAPPISERAAPLSSKAQLYRSQTIESGHGVAADQGWRSRRPKDVPDNQLVEKEYLMDTYAPFFSNFVVTAVQLHCLCNLHRHCRYQSSSGVATGTTTIPACDF